MHGAIGKRNGAETGKEGNVMGNMTSRPTPEIPTGLTLWEEERVISRSMKFPAQDGDLTHNGGPSLLTQMSSGGCKRKRMYSLHVPVARTKSALSTLGPWLLGDALMLLDIL